MLYQRVVVDLYIKYLTLMGNDNVEIHEKNYHKCNICGF